MGFYTIIFLLAVAIAVTVIAPKLNIATPILLVLAGIGVGFIPDFDYIPFDPDVIFFIFLPPILYNAAFNISYYRFNSFKNDIKTISMMAVSLVLITMIAIAVILHLCWPDTPWPLAFVIGAILSPPDAAAASGITESLNLSNRTNTILEGESLINDASALTAYRTALSVVTGGSFIFWKAGLEFAITLLGGCLIGFIIGYAFIYVLKKVKLEGAPIVSLNLLLPFVAYQLAEELTVSGVLAVVCMGFLIARRMREEKIFSEITHVEYKSIWRVLIYLLNGFIFVLMGLEFPYVLKGIDPSLILPLITVAFLIFITALVIRILILFQNRYRIIRIKSFRKKVSSDGVNPLNWKELLIIGWSGMRGIVSIATAIALPVTMDNGEEFPYRNSIIFLVVVVVILMLFIQGLGLPLLVKWLKVENTDNPKEETIAT